MASCCCCVLYLMAGSTTGVPMSSWYGGYQTATPPPYYSKATYATTSYCIEVYKYYTTKSPQFYTTTYAAPSHYTDALKYYSAPSYYTTKATEHDYACCPNLLHRGSQVLLCSQLLMAPIFLNTTLFPAATPKLSLITPQKRSSTTPKRQIWRSPVGCCIVDGWVDRWCSDVSLVWWKPNCNAAAFFYTTYATTSSCTELLHHQDDGAGLRMLPHPTTPRLPGITLFSATICTDFPKYYSVPSCYTKAPADYSTKTVKYYPEAAKYYSAPIYTTTTEAAKDDAVLTCYTEAVLSCYVELKYYTDAAAYFTTTHATPSYNPAAPKYYTEEAAYYTTTFGA
ncbi:hypothetical protein DAPPUDRAFT_105916 [Daphnia pulex]|uniref:Uncharacterized protein n=1 Tax=Daphnia pulex TaxID=6669 RepID=E9GS79_DAPPU|nr:hypothetical protein DAPPUDRAFT_105916 [Daphnia pulex]|eukprot:EFX77716.1 hypothetical protein DAPPUDRAFT_105916 [Daphnia pulex]